MEHSNIASLAKLDNSSIIKLTQDEKYCTKYKKVMNEEEYLEKHSSFNECGDESLRNFIIAINLMENEKYCTRCIKK